MLEIILILILWIYLVVQLVIFAGVFSEPRARKKQTDWPFISILVPARNEAEHIESCLKSLLQIDYPAGSYEILVGNDGSTDHTGKIIENLALHNPQIVKYQIEGQLGSAKAKANVLAQLVHKAKGEYIFVTDADITVSKTWVKNLLPHLLEPKMGIVSGTTLIEGPGFFAGMQSLEWLLANGNLLGLDHLGMKGTAVGNNMAFTREAYFKTGGFENIPFSVTEDFQLFNYIRKQGFKTKNLGQRASLNLSKPQTNFMRLLHQRKRWMMGAQGLPWYWFPFFILLSLYAPAIIILFFIHFKLALTILLIKFLLQSVFLIYLQNKFKIKTHYFYLVIFEPYSNLMNFLMLVFYLMPVKMNWKERRY